jgi:hypothetical protein
VTGQAHAIEMIRGLELQTPGKIARYHGEKRALREQRKLK